MRRKKSNMVFRQGYEGLIETMKEIRSREPIVYEELTVDIPNYSEKHRLMKFLKLIEKDELGLVILTEDGIEVLDDSKMAINTKLSEILKKNNVVRKIWIELCKGGKLVVPSDFVPIFVDMFNTTPKASMNYVRRFMSLVRAGGWIRRRDYRTGTHIITYFIEDQPKNNIALIEPEFEKALLEYNNINLELYKLSTFLLDLEHKFSVDMSEFRNTIDKIKESDLLSKTELILFESFFEILLNEKQAINYNNIHHLVEFIREHRESLTRPKKLK